MIHSAQGETVNMKIFVCLTVFILPLLLVASCLAALPVFPGAAGFGTRSPAGRGGKIVRVTSLHDHGAGSLRAALAETTPRTVVFEIGGTITLNSDLNVTSPFITIAGQTAPPPGITLKGAGLSIRTHDVLVQHLRVRVGDLAGGPPHEARDAINIIGPKAWNVVIDHVSTSWAIDENMSTWFEVHDVTISNSIISEGLHHSRHNKGPHSKGLLIGDRARNITVFRNLFAKNADRNPLIKGGSTVAIVNNLMYDSGDKKFIDMADDYASGPSFVAAIGNVMIRGKDTPAGAAAVRVHKSVKAGTQIFLADNDYKGQLLTYGTTFNPHTSHPIPYLTAMTPIIPSRQVEALVLSQAGARPGERDAVDMRIIEEVSSRTGRIIDSQQDVGGWPGALPTFRKFVAPAHPEGDDDRDGYTNLEEELYRLAMIVERRSVSTVVPTAGTKDLPMKSME